MLKVEAVVGYDKSMITPPLGSRLKSSQSMASAEKITGSQVHQFMQKTLQRRSMARKLHKLGPTPCYTGVSVAVLENQKEKHHLGGIWKTRHTHMLNTLGTPIFCDFKGTPKGKPRFWGGICKKQIPKGNQNEHHHLGICHKRHPHNLVDVGRGAKMSKI